VLDTLSQMIGVQVRTEVASERLRRVWIPVLVAGSTEKLRTATGWTRATPGATCSNPSRRVALNRRLAGGSYR